MYCIYCMIVFCVDIIYLLRNRHDELPVAAGSISAVLHGDVPLPVPVEGAVVVAAVAGAVDVLRGQHGHSVNLNTITIILIKEN